MWGAHMRKQVKLNIYKRLKDKAEVQKEGSKQDKLKDNKKI